MLRSIRPAAADGRRPTPAVARSVAARSVPALAVLLLAALCLSACGDGNGAATQHGQSQSASAGGSSSSGQATAPKVVDVTFDGDSVTPNGERVEVSTGQDVELHVTADAPGEIHVHSSPEQELSYGAGTSTVTITGLVVPGTVEVESHQLDKVILQLQVS